MGKQLSIDSLFDLTSVSAPTIHPTGTKIIYVKTTILKEKNTYSSQLFCYDVTTKQTTQWTNTEGQNFAPTWSKDGSKLLFISTRTGKAQAYILHNNGGEAEQLTYQENGISSALFSPTNDAIFFTASVKDRGKENTPKKLYATDDDIIHSLKVDKMVYRSDTIGFFDTNAHKQVFRLQLDDMSTTQLTYEATDYNLSAISPDGTAILYSRLVNIENEKKFDTGIYEFNIVDNTETSITSEFDKGSFSSACYAPDNQNIAFIGSNKPVHSGNVTSLFVYNRATKAITNLWGKHDMYVGDCGVGDFKQKNTTAPIQWYDNETIFLTTSHFGKVSLYQVNIAGDYSPIINGWEQVFDFDLRNQCQQLVIARSNPTTPNEIYLIDLTSKQQEQITHFNDQYLTDISLGEYIEVEYTATDGGMIHGFLVKPSNFDENKTYPLIYDIHGGPHAMHAATFFHEVQVMAAKGYAVLLLNPRGSHGYGQNHVNGVLGAYGEGDYTDLMQGLDGVLHDYHWLDANQLYVTGGSYGGFMTNWIVTQTTRFRSAVTQRSISNWASFTGVSDIGYYFTEWEMNTDNFDFSKMWKHSPLAYVKNVETPLLILHSEEDYRCPMEQAEQFYTYLKFLDKKTELIRFPKSSHELSRSGIPSLRIERLTAIFDWFEQNR